jgi:bifunctional non-homologous end joining protein LigD
MVWDRGEWAPENGDIAAALQKGDLKFTLYGKKLHGSWVLVRTRGYGSKADKTWLLIKHRDQYASTKDVTEEMPRSVLSKRLMVEIARDEGGDVEKAATGDPQQKSPKRKSATANPRARTTKKSKAKKASKA